MQNAARTLFVCPPHPTREKLLNLVDQTGATHVVTSTVAEAQEALKNGAFDLIITGRGLSDGNFDMVLRATEASQSYAPVVVVSRSADWDEFIEALERGAFDFLAAEGSRAEAARVIDNALRASRARRTTTKTHEA